MYLRIHKTQNGTIVAACDRELIGQELTDGDVCIDLKKYSSFYKEKLITEKELSEALKMSFNSANLVGKKAVNTALMLKIASKSNVKYIKNIPYIQIYSI